VCTVIVMDASRLAKSPNEDNSDDEAKGSDNANDPIKIKPITYKDVQSATEQIYSGGIKKTGLKVSPTRGINNTCARSTHPQHTSFTTHCTMQIGFVF